MWSTRTSFETCCEVGFFNIDFGGAAGVGALLKEGSPKGIFGW